MEQEVRGGSFHRVTRRAGKGTGGWILEGRPFQRGEDREGSLSEADEALSMEEDNQTPETTAFTNRLGAVFGALGGASGLSKGWTVSQDTVFKPGQGGSPSPARGPSLTQSFVDTVLPRPN